MTQASGSQIILFDMETTGIDREVDQVCQLAAVPLTRQNLEYEDEDEDDVFTAYVLPTRSFHGEATKVNGFTIDEGSLFKGGNPLPTISLEKAYKSFFEYLKLKTNSGDKLTLVGYNSKQFDMAFLRRDCHKFGIPVAVEGRQLHFADAFLFLLAVRNFVLPGIGSSMTQESVHQYLCPDSSGSHRVCHDAVADVLNLREILLSPKVPLEQLSQHEFNCFPKKRPEIVTQIERPSKEKLCSSTLSEKLIGEISSTFLSTHNQSLKRLT